MSHPSQVRNKFMYLDRHGLKSLAAIGKNDVEEFRKIRIKENFSNVELFHLLLEAYKKVYAGPMPDKLCMTCFVQLAEWTNDMIIVANHECEGTDHIKS